MLGWFFQQPLYDFFDGSPTLALFTIFGAIALSTLGFYALTAFKRIHRYHAHRERALSSGCGRGVPADADDGNGAEPASGEAPGERRPWNLWRFLTQIPWSIPGEGFHHPPFPMGK